MDDSPSRRTKVVGPKVLYMIYMHKSPKKEISYASPSKTLLHVHIFPLWKRLPKISETLATDLLYMERFLHPRVLDSLLTAI